MQEAKINIDSPSTSTNSSDTKREEEMWTGRNQEFFLDIVSKCNVSGKAHSVAGRKYKRLYTMVSIPLISLPIIMSSLTTQIESISWLSQLIMVAIGLMNTLSQFTNYGGKSQKHLDFETRYFDLSDCIQCELLKRKKFWVQFDLFLERVKTSYGNLNKTAPLL